MDAYYYHVRPSTRANTYAIMLRYYPLDPHREFARVTNELTARAIVAYLLAGNMLRARALAREDHEAYEQRALGIVA